LVNRFFKFTSLAYYRLSIQYLLRKITHRPHGRLIMSAIHFGCSVFFVVSPSFHGIVVFCCGFAAVSLLLCSFLFPLNRGLLCLSAAGAALSQFIRCSLRLHSGFTAAYYEDF
jgi:hypothetical protein